MNRRSLLKLVGLAPAAAVASKVVKKEIPVPRDVVRFPGRDYVYVHNNEESLCKYFNDGYIVEFYRNGEPVVMGGHMLMSKEKGNAQN